MGAFDTPVVAWPAGHKLIDTETAAILAMLYAASADGGLVNRRVALKTSDQTYSNDATMNNDADFVFSLAANAAYAITGDFIYITTAAALFDCGWTVPAGSAHSWSTYGLPSTVTTTGVGTVDVAAHALTTVVTLGTNGGNCGFSPVGRILTTTAGTLQFQHDQHTSGTGPTGMRAGSWCAVERIG